MKKANLKTKCIILLLLVFALNYTFAATCGDVNNSGGVDIVDALMVAQFSVGLNPSGFVPTVADVNSDGSTNIVDALMVAQFYVGLISQLSCATSITPTPTSTATLQSISIACGSSAAVGSFLADQYYSGGSTYNNSNSIDVSQITSNPPPAALFNNERYGALSYTIPGFTAGGTYAVTMYFAETYLTSSGGRVFNVSINGTTVLSNFDIYAVAGAQNAAIAQAFTTTANSSGQVVIQLTAGTENPKINGINIKAGTAPTPGPTKTRTATPIPTATPTGGGSCSGSSGNVYLAFDDGPTGNSQSLCTSLTNAGACKATFFVIGQNMPGNSSAYKNAGFSVQNHSKTHSHMTSWSYQQVYDDLNACSTSIQNAGFSKPTVIRLPYLESNSTIQSACTALGLQIISPSVDTQDWNGASTSSIVSVASNLGSGQNALLHENQANTIAGITQIVTNLKNRGMGFVQY